MDLIEKKASEDPIIWGVNGITCSSVVAATLFAGYHPLITPDEILTNIAPKLVNLCGSQVGKAPYIELMKNAEKFKS